MRRTIQSGPYVFDITVAHERDESVVTIYNERFMKRPIVARAPAGTGMIIPGPYEASAESIASGCVSSGSFEFTYDPVTNTVTVHRYSAGDCPRNRASIPVIFSEV